MGSEMCIRDRLATGSWGPRTFRYAADLLTPWYVSPSDDLDNGIRRYSAVELSRKAVPNSGAITLGGFPRRRDLGTILHWQPTRSAEMSLTIVVNQSGSYEMTAGLAAWNATGGVSFELNGSPIGQNPVIEKARDSAESTSMLSAKFILRQAKTR